MGLKPCSWVLLNCQRVYQGFKTIFLDVASRRHVSLVSKPCAWKGTSRRCVFLSFETMFLEGGMPSTRLARFRNHAPGREQVGDAFSLVSKPCSWKGACRRHVFWGFEIMFRSSDSLVYLLTRWQNDKTLDHSFAYMPYQHVDKYCLCVDKMTKYYVVFKGYCTLVRWKIM